jgi:hypothetical protein
MRGVTKFGGDSSFVLRIPANPLLQSQTGGAEIFLKSIHGVHPWSTSEIGCVHTIHLHSLSRIALQGLLS